MTGRIAAVMTETKEGGSRYVEKGRRARKKVKISIMSGGK